MAYDAVASCACVARANGAVAIRKPRLLRIVAAAGWSGVFNAETQ